jgi:hypothetical protein
MRNDMFALYKNNIEYRLTISDKKKYKLISNDIKDIKFGFKQKVGYPNILIKEIQQSEITRAYYVTTKCKYQGREFQVVNEDGDSILLFSGSGGIEGFTCVGHGEYEKWINKKDAEKIWEDFQPINGLPF